MSLLLATAGKSKEVSLEPVFLYSSSESCLIQTFTLGTTVASSPSLYSLRDCTTNKKLDSHTNGSYIFVWDEYATTLQIGKVNSYGVISFFYTIAGVYRGLAGKASYRDGDTLYFAAIQSASPYTVVIGKINTSTNQVTVGTSIADGYSKRCVAFTNNGILILNCDSTYMRFYDIKTNINAPTLVASATNAEFSTVWDMQVLDKYLYLTNSQEYQKDHLIVFNIENISSPVVTASFNYSNPAFSPSARTFRYISFSYDKKYMIVTRERLSTDNGWENGGFSIYDITNPSVPSYRCQFMQTGSRNEYATRVIVKNGFLYITSDSNSNAAASIYNITNVYSPLFIGDILTNSDRCVEINGLSLE